MAQGTTSLLSNTVYAISDAATQFSKAAHKVSPYLEVFGLPMDQSPRFYFKWVVYLQGIVAFTYDDQAFLRMEQQQIGGASHSKGVINEVFEVIFNLGSFDAKNGMNRTFHQVY